MSWISGSCYLPPSHVSREHISADEPVILTDAEARADENRPADDECEADQ
ncbi:hypothetical protein [Haloechinothrix salitolerans]|uniref:Uncharacterized protein n=1 Tax=Haloechinothrix salitolerans TaxID=926830 RepID=A0ABW2BUZ0_9PSEU